MQWPYSDYLVCRSQRLIYCPIPKVACSSLKLWFFELAGLPRPPIVGLHAHVAQNRKRFGLELRAEDLRNPTFFRFVFVRDPFRRLVSAYGEKLVRRDAGTVVARPIIEAIQRKLGRHVDVERGVTFREFVEHVSETPDMELNEHWRPQHTFLGDAAFDFIGSQESLRAGLSAVAEAARLCEPPPLDFANVSQYAGQGGRACVADVPRLELRAAEATPHWRDFYDDSLRQLVRERYGRDFELHGEAKTPVEAALRSGGGARDAGCETLGQPSP